MDREKFLRSFRKNSQFSDENNEVIMLGFKKGHGTALENKKHNFVYVIGEGMLEGKRKPIPDGLPQLISNQRDAEKVKKRIQREIEQETKEFVELAKKIQRRMSSAS